MIIVYSACFLVMFSFLLFSLGLSEFEYRPTILEKFRKKRRRRKGILFIISGFLSPLNTFIVKGLGLKEKLLSRLERAGWSITPSEFLALKEMLIIVIISGLYLMDIRRPLWYIIGGGFGFIFPDLTLANAIKRRKENIVKVLPETVDLLGLCVGAGLDFMTAVRWVIEKASANPMIEELARVLEEVRLGKPRARALKDMGKRIDHPDVASFVRTLVQADRMGTSVEEVFGIISEDIRRRRFERGQRQASKSSVKVLIPLLFCILPIIFIIVAGPIIIRFSRQGIFNAIMK